jgi:rod shape-determining protein MreC
MIRLSIQARQALARLTLPVLIVVSFGVMLLGKADTLLADRARIALADGLAPIYAALATPLARIHAAITETVTLWDMREENDRLRAENEKLRRWQSIALALDAENQRLKASLRWIPDPTASFVTARVVADAGGVYARAVLLSIGPNSGIRKGEIAVDERGLVGRITEVGARTARVLLITDLNSRIPVILETSRAHAILVGTNGPRPRLLYWPEGIVPREGERIVTSAEANAFPANLPIGTVHYTSTGAPEVEPAAMLQKLEVVRIFDYGLNGMVAPERPATNQPPPNQPPPNQLPSNQVIAGQPATDRPTPNQPQPDRPTPGRH